MPRQLIPILIFFKLFFSLLIFYIYEVYLGWNMFKYPDFYTSYNNCSVEPYTNILYSKFFCSLSVFEGDLSFDSTFFISTAALINMLMLIGYFNLFEKYLNNNGKYLLIAFFVLHPYMNIYFFRFYTDLFGALGLFLIIFYKLKNININIIFILLALILMNFRNGLIPVFLLYGAWELIAHYKRNNYRLLIFSALLILFSVVSYLPALEFSLKFASINQDINFFDKLFLNIIFLFGYRETTGISREIFILNHWTDIIIFITSFCLLTIHIFGLFGTIKFLILKHKVSLIVIFSYIFLPLLSIAHMRYLIPLMPILLFGFSFLFFGKKNNQTN